MAIDQKSLKAFFHAPFQLLLLFFSISELDFAFLRQLRSQVQGMRTKCAWQPALRQLFSFPSSDDRQVALQFLLEAMKTFQVVT